MADKYWSKAGSTGAWLEASGGYFLNWFTDGSYQTAIADDSPPGVNDTVHFEDGQTDLPSAPLTTTHVGGLAYYRAAEWSVPSTLVVDGDLSVECQNNQTAFTMNSNIGGSVYLSPCRFVLASGKTIGGSINTNGSNSPDFAPAGNNTIGGSVTVGGGIDAGSSNYISIGGNVASIMGDVAFGTHCTFGGYVHSGDSLDIGEYATFTGNMDAASAGGQSMAVGNSLKVNNGAAGGNILVDGGGNNITMGTLHSAQSRVFANVEAKSSGRQYNGDIDLSGLGTLYVTGQFYIHDFNTYLAPTEVILKANSATSSIAGVLVGRTGGGPVSVVNV